MDKDMDTEQELIKPENIKEGFITDDAEIFERLIRIQLTSLRKSKHLTQKKLAELSGLSVGTISNIESLNNSSSIHLSTLSKYLVGIGAEMYIKFSDDESDKTIEENDAESS